MIPTLRTPASASPPPGPSALAGRLAAPRTRTAPAATTASLLKPRIASLPKFCLFVVVKQTSSLLFRQLVGFPRQEAALQFLARALAFLAPSDQRSPPHIDVLHLRITDDFIEALFFADSALLPASIGRADIPAVGIDPDVTR